MARERHHARLKAHHLPPLPKPYGPTVYLPLNTNRLDITRLPVRACRWSHADAKKGRYRRDHIGVELNRRIAQVAANITANAACATSRCTWKRMRGLGIATLRVACCRLCSRTGASAGEQSWSKISGRRGTCSPFRPKKGVAPAGNSACIYHVASTLALQRSYAPAQGRV